MMIGRLSSKSGCTNGVKSVLLGSTVALACSLAVTAPASASKVFLASTAEKSSGDAWQEAYLEAQKQEVAGKWSAAAKSYKEATEAIKSSSGQDAVRRRIEFLYKRGICQEADKDYKSAIGSFKDCEDAIDDLNLAPKIWKAACQAHLANDYFKASQADDAEKAYAKALSMAEPILIKPAGTGTVDARLPLINNQGVKALNAADYLTAIQKFKEALAIDPTYTLAIENLAIAYNNYGMKVKQPDGLIWFYRAEILQPSLTKRQNIDSVVKSMGKDPRSAAARKALADKLYDDKTYEGAVVEYGAAYELDNSLLSPSSRLYVPTMLYLAYKHKLAGEMSESKVFEAKAKEATAGAGEGEMIESLTASLAGKSSDSKGSDAADASIRNAEDALGKLEKKLQDNSLSDSEKAKLVQLALWLATRYDHNHDENSAAKFFAEGLANLKQVSPARLAGLSDRLYSGAVYFDKQKRHADAAELLAASVSSRLQEGNATSAELSKYIQEVQHEIRMAWKPPKENVTKRIVSVFSVYRTGAVSDFRITESSHDDKADSAASDAVKSVSPLPPLPEGSPEKVDIQFTFDYNVWDKNKQLVR